MKLKIQTFEYKEILDSEVELWVFKSQFWDQMLKILVEKKKVLKQIFKKWTIWDSKAKTLILKSQFWDYMSTFWDFLFYLKNLNFQFKSQVC